MSGVIADAISETSLDLTGLERGIDAATARLRAAVDEWSRIAVVNVQVDLDTAEAETKFEAFMARIRGRSVDVDVDIDRDRVADAVNDIDNAVDDVNDTRVNWRDIFDGLPEVGGDIERWLNTTTGEIRDGFDGIDVRPDFDFDVDEFQAGLRDLLGDLRLFQDEAGEGITVPVEPEVDRGRFRSMFDGLQGDVRSLAERLTERFNATFRGLGADADLDPARRAVQGLGDDFDNTFETAESGLSRLSSRLAQIGNRLRGSTATFTVDSDGVAEAVVQAETLTAALRSVPNRVRTRYELDGLSGALAEAIEIRAVIASIPNRTRTVVDVDTSFMDKLTGFFGGGSGGGLGGLLGKVQAAFAPVETAIDGVGDSVGRFTKSTDGLGDAGGMLASLGPKFAMMTAIIIPLIAALGVLVSSIAALVAWVIPLAAGLVSAAAGLLLLAAAATAATAAVGILAVAFDPATLDLLKGQVQQVKNALETLLAPSLAPVKSLIVDQFIPALFGQLAGVIAALAPSVTATLEPIMDAILAIIPILESVGPVAVATGQGIGRLLTTFGKFAAAVDIGAVVEQVNALFGALDGTLELLGQSGLAFLPILTQMLQLFEGLARESIGPFTEIIATFGAALPDFAASISAILEPLGQLAVIGGQGFAALAGSFDELWGIVQAVIPTLNFEVIGAAWQRILPTMAQTLERLSPIIARIGDNWVRFTETLLTDSFVEGLARGFETLIIVLAHLTDLLVGIAPALATFFEVGLAAGRASIAVMGLFAATIFGVGEVLAQVVDGVLEAMALPLRGLASALEALPDQVVPDGWADGARGAADAIGGAADGVRDFLIEARQGAVDVAAFASGSEGVAGAFDLVGDGARSSAGELDDFKVTLNTSLGKLELVGPAARRAAAGLAVVRKQFANTIPAVVALGEELRKPSDLLAAGVDRAKAKLGEQEKTVKDSVSSMAGVSLSGVFAIDDDDVSNVRDKAKEVSDAVQEFLGRGRLAEFVEGSERSVSQALDKLARSLQQKVVNIQRLKLVDSLGFSDLAAQLGSLDADPGVLGKYLDQLFGAGTATMAQENARLAQLRGALTAGYADLGPALSAALGEDFGQEANDKIKDTTDNINVALDKLVGDVRLKAENMRRVAALDAAGFGALAESLATLNADPKALKSALDQLAAGGTAAYRSANGRLQSAGDALVAQQATLGPRLKEAFGVSGDEAAEGVEKSKVTIGLALENMREVVAEKMQAVANLKDLEAKGFNDIASYLATLDPAQINQFYNELAAGAEGGFAVVEAQLEQQTTDWKNQLVGLDPEIAAGLVASGVLTVAEIEAMGIRITNAIDEFLALPPPSEWALFGGPGVGASQAETLAGEIVAGLDKGFAQVEQSAQTRGEAVGALFTEGIRAAVIGAEVDTTAGLTESVDRIFAGLATAVQIQGETAGKAFTGGLSAGITGGEVDTTVAIGDAVERIFQGLEMGKGFTTPGTMGGTIGDLFGSRIVAAVVWAEATTTAGITGAVERIFAALQTGTAFLVAGEVGKGVGVTFNDGAVEGFRTSATRVTDSARALVVVVGTTASLAALDAGRTAGETFGAWFSFGFAVSAPDITATATGVFDALVAATSTQLVTAGTDAGARFAASISIGFTNGAFGVAVAISTLIDSTIRGVVATAVKKFTDAGVFLGLAMGAGISDGLAFSLALVKLQAIALATAIQVAIQQALGINSPSRVGMEIGAYFGEGMALGLAQSSSLVAAQANAMAVAASDAVAQSFKTTAGDVVTAVTEAAGTIKAGSGRDALGKYFNILTPDGWVKRYYERTAAELDGVITAATSTAPPVAIAPDFDVSALQALALPPLSVQVIPVVDAGFLAAMRTATDSVSGFPAPIPAAAAGLPQQAAIAATAGTTDQTMLVVLQQILTAIQGIDATTDPLVLLMLQQILGNLEAPLTPEQQREQAAFVKTLVGR